MIVCEATAFYRFSFFFNGILFRLLSVIFFFYPNRVTYFNGVWTIWEITNAQSLGNVYIDIKIKQIPINSISLIDFEMELWIFIKNGITEGIDFYYI